MRADELDEVAGAGGEAAREKKAAETGVIRLVVPAASTHVRRGVSSPAHDADLGRQSAPWGDG